MIKVLYSKYPRSEFHYWILKLNEKTGIEVYDGNFERFCAIGDEHGLFIVINKAVKDWFPTNDKAFSSEFEMEMVQNQKSFRIEFVKEELMVRGLY